MDAELDHRFGRWGVIFAPQRSLAQRAAELLRGDGGELRAARNKTLLYREEVQREMRAPGNPLCRALSRLDLCTSKGGLGAPVEGMQTRRMSPGSRQ